MSGHLARRAGLAAVAVLALLTVVAGVAYAVLFDPAALKARAADAVRRATGRELTIGGTLGVAWSLSPSVTADDVTLANPPEFSRPAMAHVRRVEVQVALWPLLSRRIEVRRVALIGPDVLLERDAAGRPNWQFAPPEAPAGNGPPQPSATPRMPVTVDVVEVRDGRVAWQPADGAAVVLDVPALAARPGTDGRMDIQGTLGLRGVALAVSGQADAGGRGPLDLIMTGAGVRAQAQGPSAADVVLHAEVADLAALGPLAGLALPAVTDVRVSARLRGTVVSDVSLEAGAVALPGLRVVRMTAAAAAMDGPVTLAVEAESGGAPVAVAAKAGSLTAVLAGGTVPVEATVAAAGATVSGQGTLDVTGRALDLAVAAAVPDMAALGPVVGAVLPPWRDVRVDGRLTTVGGGALAFRALRVASPAGTIAGDVVLGFSPRPVLRGTLVSQRLDLDALTRPMPASMAPALSVTPGAAPGRAQDVRPPMLSDAPLPWDALRRMDADLRWVASEVLWRGAVMPDIEARVLLGDGRLRLDPVRVSGFSGRVVADAGAQSLMVALRGAGAMTGVGGQVDADVQLSGAGPSTRAIAAALDGSVGLALVDGEVESRWLLGLLGDALRGVPLDMKGRSAVRCLALRLDVAKGQATIRTLLLDATRLRLEGDGSLFLAEEALDVRLRVLLKLGATPVSIPVHLTGPWRSPRAEVAQGGNALVIGVPGGPDPCPAALASARDGRSGPLPAGALPGVEASKPLRPADLLRSLIR